MKQNINAYKQIQIQTNTNEITKQIQTNTNITNKCMKKQIQIETNANTNITNKMKYT